MSKVCSKCGTENSDIRDTCMSCGEPLTEAAVPAKKKISVMNLIGMLAGIAFVVIGLISIFSGAFVFHYNQSGLTFGADFYTEIHKAVVGVGNTVGSMSEEIEGIYKGTYFILTAIGAFMTCYFGRSIKSE